MPESNGTKKRGLRPLSEKEKRQLSIYVAAGEYVASKTCVLYGDEVGELTTAGDAQALRKLVKKEHALEYIEELQRHQGIILTSVRNHVVEEYSALAFSNLADVVRVTDTGAITVRAFDDLPKQVQSAVKSIKLSRKKSGDEWEDVLEIQMHDKKGALDGLSHVLNLQRRIGEELSRDEEENALQFVGVSIKGPPEKKTIDLSMPPLLLEGEA